MVRRPEDRGSRFEDEGIPDLQDGTPEQQQAEDPEEMPLPAENPVAVDDWGTTAEEQREGEPLDVRLRREEPDDATFATDDLAERVPYESGLPQEDAGWPIEVTTAGRLVAESDLTQPDPEPDVSATDEGTDAGGFSPEERAMRVQEE